MSTDDAESAGITVPRSSSMLRQRLKRHISEAGSSVAHPVDSAMLAEPSLLLEAIRIIADSREVDLVLVRLPFAVGGPPLDMAVMKSAAEAVLEAEQMAGMPLALIMPHGDSAAISRQFMELRRLCLAARFPLFSTTSRAARAMTIFMDAISVWRRSLKHDRSGSNQGNSQQSAEAVTSRTQKPGIRQYILQCGRTDSAPVR